MIYAIWILAFFVAILVGASVVQGEIIIRLRGKVEAIELELGTCNRSLYAQKQLLKGVMEKPDPVRHTPRQPSPEKPKQPRTMTEWRRITEADAAKDSE